MDIKLDQPHKVTTFQIQWRPKHSEDCGMKYPWHDLEGEQWANPDHATDRLSYWNKLSIASLLEFRVHQVELETK